jgi:hypothetical protein
MVIDPSGRGRDETGYAVVKHSYGTLYCTALGGLQGGYEEGVLVKLAQIAKEHKVNYIIIESNFGDGMFTQILSPVLARIYPCSTEEIRHNVQKEKRIIDTLEPVFNRHKMVIDPSVLKADLEYDDVRYSFCYQLTHLTRDRGSLKHDDRLDALAMAVAYWVEVMARDEQNIQEDHKSRMWDEELRKMNEIFVLQGSAPPSNTSWKKLR